METSWEISDRTRSYFYEVFTIVSPFEQVGDRITIRSVVGRFQRNTVDDSQTDRRKHSKASVADIEVQILGIRVIDGIGHTFGSWAVAGGRDNFVTWLGHIAWSLGSEEFHFSDLHTAAAAVNRREKQTIRGVRNAVVKEDVIGVETRWEVSHITRGNLGKVFTIVRTLQKIGNRIPVRCIVG